MWNERGVTRIGIGIVGGGYMGKAHAVAMSAVAAVFDTALRPSLEMICTTTPEGAADKARQFGFARATSDWRVLVADPRVEAVVIASPQDPQGHRTRGVCGRQARVLREAPWPRPVRQW
jgi:predicted dehydrogenase